LKTLTEGRGVDVVCDPVGGRWSELALRSMAWRGRHLVIGFADGEIPRIALNLPLLKGCSVVGVFWGDYTKREPAAAQQDLRELNDLLRVKKIAPLVSMRCGLDRAGDAIAALMRRQVVGKAVVLPALR
jgi:NADPH2:quinone reductase